MFFLSNVFFYIRNINFLLKKLDVYKKNILKKNLVNLVNFEKLFVSASCLNLLNIFLIITFARARHSD